MVGGLALFCFALVLLIPVIVFLITFIFRQACVLSGLPKPSIMTALGIMLLTRVSTTVAEAVMQVIVADTCQTAGLPRWEAGIIVLFLFLPIDLLISAGLHAGLMNIKFGKGLEIWFLQMLMIVSLLTAVAFVLGLLYLATN